MNKSFNITILNPEKTIYEGKALSLIVPCENGYLGVLADHASLVGNVVAGKITLRINLDEEPRIFHSSGKGFLEVFKNNVNLLFE